jgi:hypothetical protein
MTSRTSHTAKDRDRIDWLLRNPPHYDADAVRALMACCLTPPPDDLVDLLTFQVLDGEIEEKLERVKRSDALIERLTSALNVFLIERTLESEPSIGDTHRRLRIISEAADHLKRVLGLSNDTIGPQLPWPIGRRFMQAMGHSGERELQKASTSEVLTDAASRYLARAQVNRTSLSEAISGLNLVHQWALAASRLEKSLLMRRRKQPDLALGRLVQTMSSIWTEVLGQDLRIASNNGRNVGRWAPIPESYQHFVAFVRASMKPIGVEISVTELRAAITGEVRRRVIPKRTQPKADASRARLAPLL